MSCATGRRRRRCPKSRFRPGIRCTCRPCSLLFDRRAAGAGHLRLIGERRLRLLDFDIGDAAWDELRIPVEMAFFFRDSTAARVRAFYPSPMGPTESQLGLEAWQDVELDYTKDNRVYLPQDEMARFGVAERHLEDRLCDAAWQGLMDFQVQRARKLMLSGAPLRGFMEREITRWRGVVERSGARAG